MGAKKKKNEGKENQGRGSKKKRRGLVKKEEKIFQKIFTELFAQNQP